MNEAISQEEGAPQKTKRVYSQEFKKQALELAVSLKSYTQAARQLGIKDNLLHSWKKSFGITLAARPVKPLSESELELKRLRKEVEHLKKVNSILKSATAFFSQAQLK